MKRAMIFAAGMGTRLKPLTDNMPKALVEVCGKPLLAHVIDKMKSAGYGSIVVNVHHFADMIEDYLRSNGNFGIDIRISDERDVLLDTGGGILNARSLLESYVSRHSDRTGTEQDCEPGTMSGHFLVHNVDIMSDLDIDGFVSEADDDAIATLVVSERKTSRYLLFNDEMRLVGWTNVATGEVRSPYLPDGRSIAESVDVRRCRELSGCRMLAFSGIHLMSDRIFDAMEEWKTCRKFPIMDFYLSVAARYRIKGFVQPGMRLLDVGKLDSIAAAEEFCRSGGIR